MNHSKASTDIRVIAIATSIGCSACCAAGCLFIGWVDELSLVDELIRVNRESRSNIWYRGLHTILIVRLCIPVLQLRSRRNRVKTDSLQRFQSERGT